MNKLLVTIYDIELNPEIPEISEDDSCEIYEKKYIEEDEYDSLPSIFTSKNNWPTHTNLKCLNCGCVTKRIPGFIPVSKNTKGDIIRGTNPHVCSKSCAYTQIYLLYKGNQLLFIQELVDELFDRISNCNIQVTPAPYPSVLRKYGGTMTDDEFQHEIYFNNQLVIESQYANKEWIKEESFMN